MTRKLTAKRLGRTEEEPPVNPMDSVGNMADTMLVLAVGIMLALVVNWNVDLAVVSASKDKKTQASKSQQTVAVYKDQIQSAKDSQKPDEKDLTKMGAVYYDKTTGNYYIIKGTD